MKFDFRKLRRNTLGGVLLHIFLAFGTLLLLCLLFFFAYLPASTNHGESITVPNIEGRSMDDAEGELARRTLRYEISDSSYSEDYPPLTVLKQYPHAGAKVKEGRKIFVSINSINPPTVPVPDLVDGSVVNADAVLRSNQLRRGKIEEVPGPFRVVKEMRLQGRRVEPGTRVPKGSVIDLLIMDGGSSAMPEGIDVMGLSLEDAKVVIFGYNLNLGSVTVLGDTTGANAVVVKQKPAPGENIVVGDNVDLWIGKPDSDTDDISNN